jgi:hypothetical protein
METKYFCGICQTIPDQISHHKAHLMTKKHRNNCTKFITEMKIFSFPFGTLGNPRKWYESEYKDFIVSKYYQETKNTNTLDNESVRKWIIDFKISNSDCYYGWRRELFNNESPMKYYSIINNLNEEIDIKNNHLEQNIDYINWGINKILKDKETISTKPNSEQNIDYINWRINKILKDKEIISTKPNSELKNYKKKNNNYRYTLSRYTNVNFNKIMSIRNGSINLKYLLNPIHHIDFSNCDVNIYNDIPLKYSCLLFNKLGMPSYNINCCDLNNLLYFYKEITIEHISKVENIINYNENKIERRQVWLSCSMSKITDFIHQSEKENKEDLIPITFSYITNDDFKNFIKTTLIDIFTNEILENEKNINDGINHNKSIFHLNTFHDKNIYLQNELSQITNMSLESNIIKSIIHICQYLFEYDERLIYHYKCNSYIETNEIIFDFVFDDSIEIDEDLKNNDI